MDMAHRPEFFADTVRFADEWHLWFTNFRLTAAKDAVCLAVMQSCHHAYHLNGVKGLNSSVVVYTSPKVTPPPLPLRRPRPPALFPSTSSHTRDMKQSPQSSGCIVFWQPPTFPLQAKVAKAYMPRRCPVASHLGSSSLLPASPAFSCAPSCCSLEERIDFIMPEMRCAAARSPACAATSRSRR